MTGNGLESPRFQPSLMNAREGCPLRMETEDISTS
jgi:hypothetical protein